MFIAFALLLLLLLLMIAADARADEIEDKCGRVALRFDNSTGEYIETLAPSNVPASGQYRVNSALGNTVGSHPDCLCNQGYSGPYCSAPIIELAAAQWQLLPLPRDNAPGLFWVDVVFQLTGSSQAAPTLLASAQFSVPQLDNRVRLVAQPNVLPAWNEPRRSPSLSTGRSAVGQLELGSSLATWYVWAVMQSESLAPHKPFAVKQCADAACVDARACDDECGRTAYCNVASKQCTCARGFVNPPACSTPSNGAANACPNECSEHGTCLLGVCQCEADWHGADCSLTSKPPLEFGVMLTIALVVAVLLVVCTLVVCVMSARNRRREAQAARKVSGSTSRLHLATDLESSSDEGSF